MAYLKLIYTYTLFFLSLTPLYTSFSQTSYAFTVYVVLRLVITLHLVNLLRVYYKNYFIINYLFYIFMSIVIKNCKYYMLITAYKLFIAYLLRDYN